MHFRRAKLPPMGYSKKVLRQKSKKGDKKKARGENHSVQSEAKGKTAGKSTRGLDSRHFDSLI